MTRARDISNVITDANLGGTLDVSGAFTSQGIDDNADANAITIDSSERVGIGNTTPDGGKLHVTNSTGAIGYFQSTQASANVENIILNSTQTNSSSNLSFQINDGTTAKGQVRLNGDNSVAIHNTTSLTEQLRITSDGKVGIGETSPQSKLHIKTADASATADSNSAVVIEGTDATRADLQFLGDAGAFQAIYFGDNSDADIGRIAYDHTGNSMRFNVNASERMRIDSNGHVLFGTTTDGTTAVGTVIRDAGEVLITRDSNPPLLLNRNTSSGDVIEIRKDNTRVGGIVVRTNDIGISEGDTGIKFLGDNDDIRPCNASNVDRDDAIDLGDASARFDDIFATNTSISTSDKNEKQDIEELSEAEKKVAVACKSLLRKYKWKKAVTEKSDKARIHFGIIAQDLEDAFKAEGLDASKYAMFCSDTWTDEDGKEHTRLGVRYSELLAFIISAI
jgi:hypothetical protein